MKKRVMILGSEGQIGKPLVEYFDRIGHKTYYVDIEASTKLDLRNHKDCGIVDYWMQSCDFVYFLAFDVGGSKYLKEYEQSFDFIQNNTQIMSNVFDMLEKNKTPFVFASSAMAQMPWSTYGQLKRLGEAFTKSLDGVSTRFWNVYGPEPKGEKAHVITDFIEMADRDGIIKTRTDGSEQRDFMYVEDCCTALHTIMEHYDEFQGDLVTLATRRWTTIESVANIVASHYGADIQFAAEADTVQLGETPEPTHLDKIERFWKPGVSVEEGIARMVDHYEVNK